MAAPKPVTIKWHDQNAKSNSFKYATLGICLFLFFLLPLMSLKVGMPSDEPIDAAYGKAALKYYLTGGKDTSYSDFIMIGNVKFPLQKYYGAGFEASSEGVAKLFGTPEYATRHFMVALCGATMILFTGLFAAELYGWLAALIAVLLMAFSPTLIGHSLFNTKDVPLATGFIIAMYFFVRWIKKLPVLSIPDMLGSVIGIGIAIGIRIGGLLLIAYFILFLVLHLALNKKIRTQVLSPAKRVKFYLDVGLIIFLGILAGNLFYPNFFRHGLSHISEALTIAKKFPVKVSMLYKGKVINAANVPADYIPWYMMITFPLQLLAGLLIFFISLRWLRKTINPLSIIILLFCAVFPVIYVIATKANVYNGWRHVLFTYPFFVSVAAVGYAYLYSKISKAVWRIAYIGVVAASFINTGVWIYSNNPYQYMYYNELVGGVKGAYTYYDTDYQQLAAFSSYKWLVNSPEYRNNHHNPKSLACNNKGMLYYDKLDADSAKFIEAGAYKDFTNAPWQFAIMSTIFVKPELIRYSYPPKGTIHEEQVSGVPISCVLTRENDYDLVAMDFCRQNKVDSGLHYLVKAYNYNPKNFRLWKTMGSCYAIKGDFKSALNYFTAYQDLFPEDQEIEELIEQTRKNMP